MQALAEARQCLPKRAESPRVRGRGHDIHQAQGADLDLFGGKALAEACQCLP